MRLDRPAVTRALLAAALLAGLVGCSDGGDGEAPERAGSIDVPEEPIDGGRIRLGVEGPVVVDPVEASLASPTQLMVLDLLHDGLARLSPDGTPQPALAASWSPSADRSRWSFELDPEATFSDGTPVTAADVVASLERVAAAGDESLAALRLEHIKGFRLFVDGDSEHIEGLSAPDDNTLRVVLDTPISVLPQLLASPVYGIVDPASIDDVAEGVPEELPLSGSWELSSADGGDLVLERRSDRAGHLDAVELRAYEDLKGAYEGFEDGDVDWAAVPSDRFDEAVDRYGDGHFAPFHAELYFGMNVRSGQLLSNRSLRQAIATAIDREAIVDEVYSELASPLRAIVPDGVVGHAAERCETCGYDPDRARQLVAEAFPDGDVPQVHIDFDESLSQRQMAEIVAAGLEDSGIPTELRPRPREEYQRFVVSGDQELFSFGWIGVYGSPDAYLTPQLLSTAGDDLTGLSSPEIDELLAGARTSGVPAERAELWASAEERALSAAVLVPIAQFRTQVVVAPAVQDLSHAVDGSVDWSKVWLAESG